MSLETVYKSIFNKRMIISTQYDPQKIYEGEILKVKESKKQNLDENQTPLEEYEEIASEFEYKYYEIETLESFKSILRIYLKGILGCILDEESKRQFQTQMKHFGQFLFETFEELKIYVDPSFNYCNQMVFYHTLTGEYYYIRRSLIETQREIKTLESQLVFQEQSLFEISTHPIKGRCLLAREDIPAGTTLIMEKPLYFFNQKNHEEHGYNQCPVCVPFYTPEFFDNIQDILQQVEPSSIHLMAEIIQSNYIDRNLFIESLKGGAPQYDQTLDNSRKLIWGYMRPEYKIITGFPLFLKCFNKIVSNCHVTADPPGAGACVFFASTINHDCDNNCVHWGENGNLNVTAFKDIRKGEEITVTYIADTYRPKRLRQELMKFRGFDCLCKRCESDRELVEAFECPECKEGLLCPETPDSRSFGCDKCSSVIPNFTRQSKSEKIDGVSAPQMSDQHYEVYQINDDIVSNQFEKHSCEDFKKISLKMIACNEYLRGKYDPENIWFLNEIGEKYASEQDYERAVDFFAQAHALSSKIFGESSKRTQIYKNKILNPESYKINFQE